MFSQSKDTLTCQESSVSERTMGIKALKACLALIKEVNCSYQISLWTHSIPDVLNTEISRIVCQGFGSGAGTFSNSLKSTRAQRHSEMLDKCIADNDCFSVVKKYYQIEWDIRAHHFAKMLLDLKIVREESKANNLSKSSLEIDTISKDAEFERVDTYRTSLKGGYPPSPMTHSKR